MSGGRFNYSDSNLKNEMFGYGDKMEGNPFEDAELSEMAFELFELIHELDWYLSGDTSRETYLEAKKKFKTKWLRNKSYNKDILIPIIEQEFEKTRQELIEML